MGWTGHSKEIKSKKIKLEAMRALDKNKKGYFVGVGNRCMLFKFENDVELCNNPVSYSVTLEVEERMDLYRSVVMGYKEFSINELKPTAVVTDDEIHWESWIVMKTRWVR